MNIRLYQDTLLSLSSLYSLEKKLENAFSSHVWLKSGGFLVIEPTEALTVIDVNSGKYEAGRNANETYRKINLEELLHYMRELTAKDRISTRIIDITPLGLMEITRKKINKPLREQFKVCPRKEDPDGINKI